MIKESTAIQIVDLVLDHTGHQLIRFKRERPPLGVERVAGDAQRSLDLDATSVSELSPLAMATGLEELYLSETDVADLVFRGGVVWTGVEGEAPVQLEGIRLSDVGFRGDTERLFAYGVALVVVGRSLSVDEQAARSASTITVWVPGSALAILWISPSS